MLMGSDMHVSRRWRTAILLALTVAACGEEPSSPTSEVDTSDAPPPSTDVEPDADDESTDSTDDRDDAGIDPGQICSVTRRDDDGDDKFERTIKSYFRDERWSHPVRQEVSDHSTDFESDTYVVEIDWHPSGRVGEERVDFDADGSFEWVSDYSYTEDGRLTHFDFDNDNDGEPEFVRSLGYTELGQQTFLREDGAFDSDTWEVLEEADGKMDFVVTIEWENWEDLAHVTVDSDNDGILEYEERYVYDDEGNQIRVEKDGALGSSDWHDVHITASGEHDILVEREFDKLHNMIEMRQDGFFVSGDHVEPDIFESSDGTWDFLKTDVVYDSYGRPVEWLQDGRRGVDRSWSMRADGVYDRYQTVTWATVPMLRGEYRVTYIELDAGDDGTIDFIESTRYDDYGNPLSRDVDGLIDDRFRILEPADGSASDQATIVWRDPFRKSKYKRDRDGDGVLEVDETWVYDEDGRLVIHERDGYMPYDSFELGPQGAADGHTDLRVAYAYDDEGRMTQGVKEEAPDSKSKRNTVWSFEQEWGPCEALQP
jgi:hypothetical protein